MGQPLDQSILESETQSEAEQEGQLHPCGCKRRCSIEECAHRRDDIGKSDSFAVASQSLELFC